MNTYSIVSPLLWDAAPCYCHFYPVCPHLLQAFYRRTVAQGMADLGRIVHENSSTQFVAPWKQPVDLNDVNKLQDFNGMVTNNDFNGMITTNDFNGMIRISTA